jgi:hypothetical protein
MGKIDQDTEIKVVYPDETEYEDESSEEEDRGLDSPPSRIDARPEKLKFDESQIETGKKVILSTDSSSPDSYQFLLDEETARKISRNDQSLRIKGTLPKFPEVIGITNFHNNCYFNSALQLLRLIPNVESLMAEPVDPDNPAYASNKTDVEMYNDFRKFTSEALQKINTAIDVYRPTKLRYLKYFTKRHNCQIIISNFLSEDSPIGIRTDQKHIRFIELFEKISVEEAVSQYHTQQMEDTLLFLVNRSVKKGGRYIEDYFRYPFPYLFRASSTIGDSEETKIFL